MKVIYNWLKDFVDITASPADVASRLALSGTNIGSVENGPHGAVIDAEVSFQSSRLPWPLRHRPRSRAIYSLPLKPLVTKPVEGARQKRPKPQKSKSNPPNSAAASPRASFAA